MQAETARARILAAVRAIPRGQVAGYGEVARRAGLPGRARLVARVLSRRCGVVRGRARVVGGVGRGGGRRGGERGGGRERVRVGGVVVVMGAWCAAFRGGPRGAALVRLLRCVLILLLMPTLNF